MLNRQKTVKILLSVFVVLWLGFIFYLSAQPNYVSSKKSFQISQQILELIEEDPPIQKIKRFDYFLRNSAHFSVFFVLSLSLFLLTRFYRLQRPYVFTLLFSSLYALSDEIHQIFVPGRAFEFSDLVLDIAGVGLGLFLWWLFIFVYSSFEKGKSTS
ncbi:MAG: VanZ family protein [Firmicutes bacterium]|nr:VanZ family protein [Bacillota bacterium]